MRGFVFTVLALLILSSCNTKEEPTSMELYYNTEGVATANVDSVSSPDGNLKIYGWCAHTLECDRDYGSLIVFRSSDGEQHVEERSIMDLSTEGECNLILPATTIFQGKENGKTVYLVQMECFGGTSHVNTVMACMQIKGDSLKPIRIFTVGSNPTNIVSNDNDAGDRWWHSLDGLDYDL